MEKNYERTTHILKEEGVALVGRTEFTSIKFTIYMSEKLMESEVEALDLSVRSANCLKRAGFKTIGDLVNRIDGSEDLRKIRCCGAKSVAEIMDHLLDFQYSIMSEPKRKKFIRDLVARNDFLCLEMES